MKLRYFAINKTDGMSYGLLKRNCNFILLSANNTRDIGLKY